MFETSLFVATIATLGMLSPGLIFSGNQERRSFSSFCRHDDGFGHYLWRGYSYVLLRCRVGSGNYHNTLAI